MWVKGKNGSVNDLVSTIVTWMKTWSWSNISRNYRKTPLSQRVYTSVQISWRKTSTMYSLFEDIKIVWDENFHRGKVCIGNSEGSWSYKRKNSDMIWFINNNLLCQPVVQYGWCYSKSLWPLLFFTKYKDVIIWFSVIREWLANN